VEEEWKAETVAGPISASNVFGNFYKSLATSVSGPIHFSNVKSANDAAIFKMSTFSGEIQANIKDFSGSVHGTSFIGRIHIPEDPSVEYSVQIPFQVDGKRGSGNQSLELSSMSGSIRFDFEESGSSAQIIAGSRSQVKQLASGVASDIPEDVKHLFVESKGNRVSGRFSFTLCSNYVN
jgi:hypothetical protein